MPTSWNFPQCIRGGRPAIHSSGGDQAVKTLSNEFAEHLGSGATTLATCWILKRSDGVSFGFTDHDRAIELEGISCEPNAGFTGTEIKQSDSFASDDQDVSGVLSSDRITEADLMSGRYDAATGRDLAC